MDNSQGKNLPIITFIAGFVIGLLIFGWWLTPVQYVGAGPQDLLDTYQQNYIRSSADLYAFDGNQTRAQGNFAIWDGADQKICEMAATTPDPADASRLTALATVLNGGGCDEATLANSATTGDAADAEGSSTFGTLLTICGLGLLLLLLGGAIYWFMQQQGGEPKGIGRKFDAEELAGVAPTTESGSRVAEVGTTPVARFRTTYKHGHDTYDDSFSIENSNGEFLGECGVGISESIGVDAPKNVSAFEVWLFDKNDIRTVTKVVMSDHAFFDEALRAKLAPKGEPVMGRQGETVVLETASLIINAVVSDLSYGDSADLPNQSYFENFTVELSAWAKDGDYEGADVVGRVDELMNY
jgi:hypothetical protein